MQKLLCCGGPGRVAPELLRRLADLGVDGIRSDFQQTDPESTLEQLYDAAQVDLSVLGIVREVSQLVAFDSGDSVEIRNEPNTQTNELLTPTQYVAAAVPLVMECLDRGIHPWIGSVFNGKGSFEYLNAVIAGYHWPAEVGVTWHRYPQGETPSVPMPGFGSRESEAQHLINVIGRRPFAISEFGYWTAPRCKKFLWFTYGCRSWSDQQVLDFVNWEFAFWDRMGAEFCALYQINDGGTSILPSKRQEKEHTFGIRRFSSPANGNAQFDWKPVASAFQ